MELFTQNDLMQRSPLSGGTGEMLVVLAELGMSKHALAALLGLDKLHIDHRRFLTGPIIQHQSLWASSTPDWLYQFVIADRVRVILDEHAAGKPGWKVGPAELAAVMYPASLDAPLQSEYADLYIWATAQAYARHKHLPLDEVWKIVGCEPVPDDRYAKSGSYHFQCYRRLCGDIRRRVVSAAKSREGEGPAKPGSRAPAAPDIEQLTFF